MEAADGTAGKERLRCKCASFKVPMSAGWSLLQASGNGTREYNDDFVAAVGVTAAKRRYFILVACDGVGSNPGSGRCAEAVSGISVETAKLFLKARQSRRRLSNEDGKHFACELEKSLCSLALGSELSTTACIVIFDKEALICVWAGDTRAYFLDINGAFECVTTTDHHDDEGRLTRFIDGDGHVEGGFATNSIEIAYKSPLVALALMTDGIHGACSTEDMRNLLSYLAFYPPTGDLELQEVLTEFLGSFASDNYSIATYLQRLRHGLQKRLEKGMDSLG